MVLVLGSCNSVSNHMQAVQICKEHDLFEDMFRCYSSLGMLYYRQLDSSKALHMLELALDVASRLEDKIQLSCELFINKAEVSHTYKTLRNLFSSLITFWSTH